MDIPTEQTSIYSGKFLGFTTLEDFRIKYMRLLTKQGEYVIKVPKDQRLPLYKTLQPGDVVTATVTEKWDDKKSLMKRRALSIEKMGTEVSADSPVNSPRIRVMVCGKSDCAQRGSQKVLQLLTEKVKELGLNQQVLIQSTGCLKQCKTGPNVVILPQKKTFQGVKLVDRILALIDQRINNSESPTV